MVSAIFVAASQAVAKTKAVPPSTTFFPAGAQRGTTSTITLSSKMEGDGRGIWIDCPGVFFQFQDKGQVQVTAAADAPLGLHLVHVYNNDGAAEPRWFSIGSLPEIQEKEPNDILGSEQRIAKLPVCINGQLEKSGSVDLYSIELAADQTLCARIEGYELGSLVDPILDLRDDQGITVATAHDGRNLDPLLLFTALRKGVYSLQVAGFSHPPAANVAFVGGAGVIYRLQLASENAALTVFPAAVSRKTKTKLNLAGALVPTTIDFDGTNLPIEPRVQRIEPKQALTAIQVAVTDLPVQTEKEPNNDFASGTPITLPTCIAGRIDKAGDEDRYLFDGKKGLHYNLRLLAKALGMPLDANLKVQDASGKDLASNDDATEGEDPLLSFKAPADGRYQIIITDLFNKGGDHAEYVLFLEPGEETFGATITSKPLINLEAGKSVEVKAKLTRVNGYAGDLTARVAGLPIGVTCAGIAAPKKNGEEFTLKLQAASNAADFNGPISIVLWTKEEKDKPLLSRPALLDLRGENRRGTSMLDVTDHLWLTVVPAKAVP